MCSPRCRVQPQFRLGRPQNDLTAASRRRLLSVCGLVYATEAELKLGLRAGRDWIIAATQTVHRTICCGNARRTSAGLAWQRCLASLPILFLLHSACVFAQADPAPGDETVLAASTDSPAADLPAQAPGGASQSDSSAAPRAAVVCGPVHLPQCLKDIAHDQVGIWTSPARVKAKDALWLAPFAAVTLVAFRTDATVSRDLGFSQHRLDLSHSVSDMGEGYSTVSFGFALWSVGAFTHHSHLAETGRLSLEALADATLVDDAMKLATNRQRPSDNTIEPGEFWEHGTRGMFNSSFPSGHAISTWAFARVIAAEYPDWRVELAAYSVATAVSISRVTGQNHFPSDVIVGSTLGYLIGGYVVHHHASRSAGLLGSAIPVADPASRTYGLGLRVQPQTLNRDILKLLGRAPGPDL